MSEQHSKARRLATAVLTAAVDNDWAKSQRAFTRLAAECDEYGLGEAVLSWCDTIIAHMHGGTWDFQPTRIVPMAVETGALGGVTDPAKQWAFDLIPGPRVREPRRVPPPAGRSQRRRGRIRARPVRVRPGGNRSHVDPDDAQRDRPVGVSRRRRCRMSRPLPRIGTTYYNKANGDIVRVIEAWGGERPFVRLARGDNGAGRKYNVYLTSFHERYEPWSAGSS